MCDLSIGGETRSYPPLTTIFHHTATSSTMAEGGAESPKRESTPTTSLSSIPQKRALDESAHSPAVPSPLNSEAKQASQLPQLPPDDASQSKSSKPARVKKDSFKKRESKAGAGGGRDSSPATPDHKPGQEKEPDSVDSGPLRYKLAPPKPSDFELPRGPVMTSHHEAIVSGGDSVEFFETSDQYVPSRITPQCIYPSCLD